jgi:hypothetical protein
LYNLVAGKPRRGEPGTGVMDRRQMQPSLFGRPGVSAAIRILQISKQLRENPGLGYATAFISVGVASGLQWLAQDQYAGSPFLTIYPAVIVTALVGGTEPDFSPRHWPAGRNGAFSSRRSTGLRSSPMRLTQPCASCSSISSTGRWTSC